MSDQFMNCLVNALEQSSSAKDTQSMQKANQDIQYVCS